jgi:preprotein translocase subunit Sss1
MESLAEELEKKLENMSDEELDELVKICRKYNGIGPTVEEYIEYAKTLYNSIYNE